MNRRTPFALLGLFGLLAVPATAQHSQVSSVVVNPNAPTEVWVCNRGNDSISVIEASTATLVAEIDVEVWPRSLAFSADGTKVFVANQRGTTPVNETFVHPFTTAVRRKGSVSVIDVATKTVDTTLTDVGTEPYGVAVAPNGEYFAVTGHRSGDIRLFSTTAPYAELASYQYLAELALLPPGKTVADADADKDFVPDLAEPRGFVIKSDSQTIYVTHGTSPWISRMDVTLNAGVPTAITLGKKFTFNEYPHQTIMEPGGPTNVQIVKSQGLPRFHEDIALSPDGAHALTPGVLHNINHDVNFAFAGIAGDFANRVYPSLTVLDTAADTYLGGDSNRLHHELSDSLTPAEHVPYGPRGTATGSGYLTLGAIDPPVLGGSFTLEITGNDPGSFNWISLGFNQSSFFAPPFGTILHSPSSVLVALGGATTLNLNVPNDPFFDGVPFLWQAAALFPVSVSGDLTFSNGVKSIPRGTGFGVNKMGYRAGQPGRVLYNAAGDRAIMLNRGSEDVFLYKVEPDGKTMELLTVFPERAAFVERAALDTTTPMGDQPLGMALVEDPSTSNNDGTLYIINETTRTLSTLWVDFDTGTISQVAPQINTLAGADQMTLSERLGEEIFEDASRAQTTGNFNNSCGSCHFEGGADSNVWQRPAGPRSTMPSYGGTLLTGLILWKGVRTNLGETGPMFGGENGGHGLFNDAEQAALRDYHEIIPTPLNPHLDENDDYLLPEAAFGRDLFFGLDDTGDNPDNRAAGCADCHASDDGNGNIRGYTLDFLDPNITGGEMLGKPGSLYEACVELQENIVAINLRNVNSGVNLDFNNDGTVDTDRDFDGYDDRESYTPLNVDTDDDFTRDDPNSYDCYDVPGFPEFGQKLFTRGMREFVIPTKLGVFSTRPYFHDHAAISLRSVVDPGIQGSSAPNPVIAPDPTYSFPDAPELEKLFNGEHDVRAHQDLVPNSSKVQLTLATGSLGGGDFDGDVEAILQYIMSL